MHTYQKKCHINLIFTFNVYIEERMKTSSITSLKAFEKNKLIEISTCISNGNEEKQWMKKRNWF